MANLYNKAGLVNIPIGYSDGFLYNIKPVDDTLAFRFNRDSAATRVNKEGLIEQVGYFGPELVQNGDFSELGPELVTNGNFSDGSTDWINVDGSATFINNYVKIQSQGSTLNRIRQIDVTQVGKTFKLSYEIIENNNVSEFKYYNGTEYVTTTSTVGTHTVYFVAGSNDDLFFNVADTNTDDYIIIDNVSVKQVDPNDRWDTDGWSISDVASSTGNGITLYLGQIANIVSGKTYKVTYTVLSNSLNNDRLLMSGTSSFSSTQIPSKVGANTVFLTAVTSSPSSGYSIRFANSSTNSSGSISIDNISVTEILGDKPRIDYTDSLTSPSFLLEPQRTNLITYSEDFSQWTKSVSGITLEDGYISPDGSNNAYKMTVPSNGAYINQTITLSNEGTTSVYVKSDNLTGEFYLVTADGSLRAQTVTDEWTRVSLTSTPSSSNFRVWLRLENAGDSIYIWGAQLEEGSYATSYIPTAGSTVTRAEETCAGAGNASTFNSTEGVLYAEISALADDLTNRSISISDGSTSNRVNILYADSTNQIRVIVIVDGSTKFDQNYNVNSITDIHKIAVKYKADDFALWVDGVERSTDTSGTIFTQNTLNELAFNIGGSLFPFYGKVKGVYVFNEALTDDELQQLTGPEYNSFAALAAAYNYIVI